MAVGRPWQLNRETELLNLILTYMKNTDNVLIDVSSTTGRDSAWGGRGGPLP
jgi:hypothetical protein